MGTVTIKVHHYKSDQSKHYISNVLFFLKFNFFEVLSLSVQISNRITISGLPYKGTVYSSGEEETWAHCFEVIK